MLYSKRYIQVGRIGGGIRDNLPKMMDLYALAVFFYPTFDPKSSIDPYQHPLGQALLMGYNARCRQPFFILYRISMGNLQKHQLTLAKDEDHSIDESDGSLAVLTEKPKLKRPPMYKVMLLNDDYTPMDFVVEILEIFFSMSREKATHVMLTVHVHGKAVCGIYTRDIAETKAAQVNQYARENQHPLLCEIEAVEDGE